MSYSILPDAFRSVQALKSIPKKVGTSYRHYTVLIFNTAFHGSIGITDLNINLKLMGISRIFESKKNPNAFTSGFEFYFEFIN
jgi:hypothetical protein